MVLPEVSDNLSEIREKSTSLFGGTIKVDEKLAHAHKLIKNSYNIIQIIIYLFWYHAIVPTGLYSETPKV